MPGGVLAVAVHGGDEVRRITELVGEQVELDFVLHDQADLLATAAADGPMSSGTAAARPATRRRPNASTCSVAAERRRPSSSQPPRLILGSRGRFSRSAPGWSRLGGWARAVHSPILPRSSCCSATGHWSRPG